MSWRAIQELVSLALLLIGVGGLCYVAGTMERKR